MDRIYESGASASAPTAPASPSDGYPTNGNPGTATPATTPGEWWYHMVTEAIVRVIEEAGLTPDHEDLDLLKDAINAMIAAAIPSAPADASETVKGIIELATSAEAQALTDTVRAITPAALAAAFQGSNQSVGSNGYQKLPGGLILQWGNVNGGSGSTMYETDVTLPLTFPNAGLIVIGTAGASGFVNGNEWVTQTWFVNTSTIHVMINQTAGVTNDRKTGWFAIGH